MYFHVSNIHFLGWKHCFLKRGGKGRGTMQHNQKITFRGFFCVLTSVWDCWFMMQGTYPMCGWVAVWTSPRNNRWDWLLRAVYLLTMLSIWTMSLWPINLVKVIINTFNNVWIIHKFWLSDNATNCMYFNDEDINHDIPLEF